ncbi:copper homeostasis protein CutC [Pseudactinotalea sp. Z1739]|uniref:copper homeostasis protein CutC n=1 Tax=Pseudactinotalea sp. Z1739 TaxID=3413028 RepID=UPI003C7B417F
MPTTPSATGLEIAIQDIEGAHVAAAHGADRVELCQALALGGLSPSRGLMTHVAATGVPFRALIRPRAGGYRYTPAEVAVMVTDVRTALECGAEGVVIGALTDDGLDHATLRTLADAADGRPVIIHRCIDVLLADGRHDPAALVEQIRATGATGVLTSGGAPRAGQGRAVIGALAAAGGGDLEIVAGGGVRPEDVPALVAAGADAVHLSASREVATGPSGPGGGEDTFSTTDAGGVVAVRAAVDALA